MDHKTYHIGLWRYARDFFWAAERLRRYDSTENVTIYLYCHSMELSLKALLIYHGSTEKELRTIGHDLIDAWDRSTRTGLNQHLADFRGVKAVIELINPYYQGKEFEYLVPGIKQFPSLADIHNASEDLLQSVGKTIDIPITQLSRQLQPIDETTASALITN